MKKRTESLRGLNMENVVEKKCPVCGKIFCPAPLHAYKVKGVLVCTYSCVLKAEREKKAKRQRKGRYEL